MAASVINPPAHLTGITTPSVREVWAAHPGNVFFVSTFGRIQSRITGRLVKPFATGGGSSGPSTGSRWRPNRYFRVRVPAGTPGPRHPSVHRLVLETFVGPCPEHMEADHANSNRFDNRLANLRWMDKALNRSRRGGVIDETLLSPTPINVFTGLPTGTTFVAGLAA